MAYPRWHRARSFKTVTKGTGPTSLNSVNWTAYPGIADQTLSAQTGDVILAGWSAYAFGNATPYIFFDVATIVAAAVVNFFGGGSGAGTGFGVPSWMCAPSREEFPGGGYTRTLLVGDIGSGLVTLRLVYRTSTATARSIGDDTTAPSQFTVQNLGPAAPH